MGEERFHFMFSLAVQGRVEENGECFESSYSAQITLRQCAGLPHVHTHEEIPLQSPLLSSWPEVWHLSLERAWMGGCPAPVFKTHNEFS